MATKLCFIVGLLGFLLVFRSNGHEYHMRHPYAYYLPENWPQYTLKLSHQGTFKDVFDSGIRPHHLTEATRGFVEFKHARVTIVLPEGQSLPEFEIDYAHVTPLFENLSQIHFRTHALTIDQAKEKMSKWLPYIEREASELDIFLRDVNDDPVRYDDRDFGKQPNGFAGGWKNRGNIERFSIYMEKAFNAKVPVRMCLFIRWKNNTTTKERGTFYGKPLKPPEGYEDYVFPVAKTMGPDDNAEMMFSKGIPFLEGRGLTGSNSNNVVEYGAKPKDATTVVNAPVAGSAKKAHSWNYVVIVAITLSFVGCYFLIRRQRTNRREGILP